MSKIVCGIYKASGVQNHGKIIIKHDTNTFLEKDQRISDTLVKSYPVCKDVNADLYTCNITHNFLISSKKIPICYFNIVLNCFMKQFLLFKIYLEFDIDDTMTIETKKDLIDKEIDGKFSIVLMVDDSNVKIDDLDKFENNEKIYDHIIQFVKSDSTLNLINVMRDEIVEKFKKEYDIGFDFDDQIPTNYISLKNYKLD